MLVCRAVSSSRRRKTKPLKQKGKLCPLTSLFLSPWGFLWRILRRRGCLWTPLGTDHHSTGHWLLMLNDRVSHHRRLRVLSCCCGRLKTSELTVAYLFVSNKQIATHFYLAVYDNLSRLETSPRCSYSSQLAVRKCPVPARCQHLKWGEAQWMYNSFHRQSYLSHDSKLILYANRHYYAARQACRVANRSFCVGDDSLLVGDAETATDNRANCPRARHTCRWLTKTVQHLRLPNCLRFLFFLSITSRPQLVEGDNK